jgi:hypothetical protein
MEIHEYKKAIRELMESGSSEQIPNSQAEHAAALFELFFDKAKYRVDIFCENLSQEVFSVDWVRKAFHGALERGISIKILLQKEAPYQEELLADFNQENLRFASQDVAALDFNFSIMDNRAYRYEPNKRECAAVASLNDGNNCGKLSDTFSTLWELSPGK